MNLIGWSFSEGQNANLSNMVRNTVRTNVVMQLLVIITDDLTNLDMLLFFNVFENIQMIVLRK